MKLNTIFCLSILSVIVGCSESDEQFGKLEQFKPDQTLAIINGSKYRKSDYDLEFSLRMRMRESAIKRMNAQKIEQMKGALRQSILASFVENRLADQMFEKTGLLADYVVRTNIETRFVRMFGKRLAKDAVIGQREVDEMLASFKDSKERKIFEENLKRAVLVETYLTKVSTNKLDVAESELDDIEVKMRQEDMEAQATNRLVYAQATNLWKQVVGGADFAALADKFSKEPGMRPGGDMGECDINDFKIEASEDGKNPVWDMVNALRVGEVTPPISTSEGLTIFRCNSRTNESVNTGAPAIFLSRIVLHRALLYPEHTRDELRMAIARERRQLALKEFSATLHRDAEISFPHGCMFLPKSIRRAYLSKEELEAADSGTNTAVRVGGEDKKAVK